jgi:hypothetical protein
MSFLVGIQALQIDLHKVLEFFGSEICVYLENFKSALFLA